MNLPKNFLCEATSKPFLHCSVCDTNLADKDFFIEKAYHRNLDNQNHSVIFEYAICHDCKTNMMKKVSKESTENIQNFMMQYQSRLIEKLSTVTISDKCTFTDTPISELEEYHLIGVVQNGKLMSSPIIFGNQIMEKYQEILSSETKDFFEDFFDSFINIPPELASILNQDVRPIMM